MPTKSLGDMVVRIVGDNTSFDSSIDKSENKFTKFGQTAQSIGGKLSLFVTAPIIAMGTAMVKSAADMEMQQAAFTTMLGSAEKAAKMLGEIKKMAAKTPFGTSDLAQASKTLLQFGVSAENILPTMKMLGDVSGGNAQRFGQLSLAFGQMSSAGRLMGQDLMQMINAGFNPLNVISQKTGESMAVLKDRMSKGGVSAQEVSEAFKIATSQGGMFFNGMETASKTFSGQMSTLMDDVSELGRSFGDVLLPILKDIVAAASKAVQSFSSLSDGQKKTILTVALFAASLGPMIAGMGTAIKTITTLKTSMLALQAAGGGPVALAIAGVVALGIAYVNLRNDIQDYKASQKEWQEAEGLTLTAATQRVKDAQLGIDAFKKLLDKATKEGNTRSQEVATERINHYTVALQNAEKEVKRLTQAEKDKEKAAKDKANTEAKQTAVTDKYKQQLEDINSIISDSKTEIEKYTLQLSDLQAMQTKGEDEKKRLEAITILQKKLVDLKAAQVKEEKESAELKADQQLQENIAKGTAEWLGKIPSAIQDARDGYASINDPIKEAAEATEELKEKTEAVVSKIQEVIGAASELAVVFGDSAGEVKEGLDLISNASTAVVKGMSGDWISMTASIIKAIVNVFNIIEAQKQKAAKALKKEMEASMKVMDMQKQILEYKIQAIQLELDAKLDSIDKAEEAELRAKGLLDKTEVESLKERIAAETDVAVKAELEKELQKAEIQDKYEKQRIAAQEAAAKQEKKLRRDVAIFERDLTVAQIKLELAELKASAKTKKEKAALAELEPLYNSLIAQVMGMPLPSLARGAVAMPVEGGTDVTVGEAGIPEAIIPLDKLNDVIRNYSGAANQGASDSGMLHLQVMMDSKPLLDKIFPATKNKTVLIHANAVVA